MNVAKLCWGVAYILKASLSTYASDLIVSYCNATFIFIIKDIHEHRVLSKL